MSIHQATQTRAVADDGLTRSNPSGIGTAINEVIDIPLSLINAQVAGTAFNIGSALPVQCKVLAAEIHVITPCSGGGATACHFEVSGGSDAVGSLVGLADVFGASAGAYLSPAGSNPYQSRANQQLMGNFTIAGSGATLALLTAGHLQVQVTYTVTPNT